MRYSHVCLESFGYVLPSEVVTSADLEEQLAPVYGRFNLHVGRLELMTGIRERRFWPRGTLPSTVAAQAGRIALEKSGVPAEQIDALFFTAVSHDFLEPATASVVHHHLSLPDRCGFFDISNACLGFLNGMITLANMIELGHVRRGLIVSGENSRSLVESTIEHLLHQSDLTKSQIKDSLASLTIGSGAAALVMAHESVSKTAHRFIGGVVQSATQHNTLCQGSGDSCFDASATMLMNTDSETLLVHGCELAGRTWAGFKTELGWSNEQVDRCFTHQVGIAHRDRLYETIGMDTAKDFSTVEFLGNIGSVSLPITMAMGLEQTPAQRGERIALLGIGSGLSCAMLGVEW